MSDRTPVYGFIKPTMDEYFTVDYFNQNADAMEAALNEKVTQAEFSSLTKADIGLGNVDNTPDSVKRVSHAQTAGSAPANGGNADSVDGQHFNWEGKQGQPNWLWGSYDSGQSYVWSPAKLQVDYATSCGSMRWGGLTEKPTAFPPEAHTHDERYYTEAEVNNLLAGKSGNGHIHDDRYFIKAEVTGALAEKLGRGEFYRAYDGTTDLNNFKTVGFYSLSNPINSPFPDYTWIQLIVINVGAAKDFVTQIAVANSGHNNIYVRNSIHDVWGAWVEVAVSLPALEYELSLAGGIATWGKCSLRKNQFNEVTVYGAVKIGSAFTSPHTIATLPEGFRPAVTLEVPATCSTGAQSESGVVSILPNGLVVAHGNHAEINYLCFTASFAIS